MNGHTEKRWSAVRNGALFCALFLLQHGASAAVFGQDASTANPDSATFPARITTIEGQTYDVALSGIDAAGHVRGQATGDVVEWPLDDILRINMDAAAVSTQPVRYGHGSRERVFYLTGGGRLHGMLLAPTGGGLSIRADIGLSAPVDIRSAGLAGIRIAPTESDTLQKEFERRLADRQPGRDVAIIRQDDKPLALQGSLERLTPEGWEFSYGGRPRKGDFSSIYGFILGATADSPRLSATVLMNSGDSFGANISSADSERVVFDTAFAGALEVPWSQIQVIELKSDRVIYVSDLRPTSETQQSLPGAVWKARPDQNAIGGPIQMRGRQFKKGIGVHAHNTLVFDLDGSFDWFKSVAGLDDVAGGHGSVIFRVRADDLVVFESEVIRGGDAPITIAADIKGARSLVLECDRADELDLSDYADWGNALLIRGKARDASPAQ